MCKILDLPENQEVAVVGTVYKEMKLKPSILQEYNKVIPSVQTGFKIISVGSHLFFAAHLAILFDSRDAIALKYCNNS